MDNGFQSDVTDATLRKYNIGACILHSVQGLLMLIASQTAIDFKKELTTSFLVFDTEKQTLVAQTKNVGSVQIAVMAAVFLLMSAAAHAVVLATFETYIANINREINYVRWYEYALSSSVMICAIAILFGCYDVSTNIAIFISNACMNLFGLLMEKMNPPNRDAVDWTPFWFGCLAGLAPWIVVFMYFLGSGNFGEIPGFVYGILVAYIVFFNTFPVNMYLQYARVGKWRDYRYGEKVYMILSLLSKSLLAWLVFGGTFQPN